ncbi:uncharacterized protein LOC135465448 [Liolophura sinensis]|uniref:uncharacterized protein LOC135465448 n=1 Tax=Liolophura sinensis TaxID=3198878 RepID=UPI00315926EA
MTVERFITVFFPHQATTLCNRRKAIVTVILVSFVLVAVNVHLVFTTESRVDTAILETNVTQVTKYCADSDDHEMWKKFIWPWVDMSVLTFIPFILFVSLNGSVLLRMAHYTRKVHAEATIPEQRLHRQRKMNSLVACICVVFLLTTGPITILHIVEPYWNRDDLEQKALHSLTVACLGHLGYLTNCVNFSLYYFRGSTFKQDLRNVLKNRSKIATMTLANR